MWCGAREAPPGSRGRWHAAAGWLAAAACLLGIDAASAAERPGARGYLTTPLELSLIRQKADAGVEPYASARSKLIEYAAVPWTWGLASVESCPDASTPGWLDDDGGVKVIYASALAYHLTGDAAYASAVAQRLEAIMAQVQGFDLDPCEVNVAWGVPELVAAADLIEGSWESSVCLGPLSPAPGDGALGNGPCKRLFQNWLAKVPYYLISLPATRSKDNRGAGATTAAAYIADYLWDRDDVLLVHRNPPQLNGGAPSLLTPAQAFAYANQLALDRMDGYGVELRSGSSCDYLSGPQQSPSWDPVKSQLTPSGVIPDDARRSEYCNVPAYNGTYENYPQVHLGTLVQQCELMLRRGDRSCYDNRDDTDLPAFTFVGPDGVQRQTHLRPGRGSLERAIRAVIVDARTEWRHDPALDVAYQYYRHYGREPGIGAWRAQDDEPNRCFQDLCLTTATHGFALEFPLEAYDASADGEARLVEVDRANGAARVPLRFAACTEPTGSVNAVRGVAAVAGLAWWRDRLYGLERIGTPPATQAWLFEMAPSICAEGTRTGIAAVGFLGLESLAACPDGSLYSVDWDATARRGRLLRIDRTTGLGALVGSHLLAQDLRVVGLACPPAGAPLWALTEGAGARVPELLRIDPATGVETLVGPTGTAPGLLQGLELDRSAGATRLLAAGTALYQVDPATGAATALGGGFGDARELAMQQPVSGPDSDGDGVPDPEDDCRDVPNAAQVDADRDGYGNLCDADFDNDGLVGSSDFVQMRSRFGARAGDAAYSAVADLTADGVIGTPDYVRLLALWGRPPGPSGLACAGVVPCQAP